MIILGLDLGEKRTGVAIAKEGHIFGRETISGWGNYDELLEQVRGVIDGDRIDNVVVGIPKSTSGDAEGKVTNIINKLESDTCFKFHTIDETLTSVEAGRRHFNAVGENNGNKDDNRESAKIILEDYLAHKSHND